LNYDMKIGTTGQVDWMGELNYNGFEDIDLKTTGASGPLF
jgi:hypothetical protein